MGVHLESGGGGRRPVDADINLIPMIDLLVVTISFLLITAVWTQLARMDVTQRTPGPSAMFDDRDLDRLVLHMDDAGFVLSSRTGERLQIGKKDGAYDLARVGEALRAAKRADPTRDDLVLAPSDGVRYDEVIAAMDTARRESFESISVSDGAS